MMLYVFHVEAGRMLSFDMTVALSSVENLKETIQRLHGIPAETIVLLVSGGEMLTQTTQVSYYSAGTDTNPIYMFLNVEYEPEEKNDKTGAVPQLQCATDADLHRLVDESLALPAGMDTVRRRTALALRMYELARDEERTCERLVHDQHLQQQGWSAVVANLDDLINEFLVRYTSFFAAFDTHLQKRAACFELLSHFEEDMEKLARIPILPSLMKFAEPAFNGFDEYLENDEFFIHSKMQQESVVKVDGDETMTKGGEAIAETDDLMKGNDKGGDIETAGGTEKSTLSTTPTKKQKMADDAEQSLATIDAQERVSQTSTSSSSRRLSLNLLQWISSKENHNALKVMAAESLQGLTTFNEDVYRKLKSDIDGILNWGKLQEVKEIKGLGERLCRLEEAKYKIKKMVKDQKEQSVAFQQNQARAINLADPSILPDLCISHQSQLQVMLANHQKIRENGRCVYRAKLELGVNMKMRLKHIVYTQNALNEIDSSLLFYHRCLRRAENHINIIEQIHRAPSIYMAAVTEVVRRKIFSGEFSMWATRLSKDFETIHKEELYRREEFNENFEGHFLNILFPGMNDMPPTFANDSPFIFDARLPNITKSDMDVLSAHLPDFANQIELPDMGPVIHFFVSRSGEHNRDCIEELIKKRLSGASNHLDLNSATGKALQHQRLGELQKGDGGSGTSGCDESETDTETEFEKVAETNCGTNVATSTTENASETTETQTMTVEMIERSTTTEPRNMMVSTETITDENNESVNAEVTRLRDLMNNMSIKSTECLKAARVDVDDFRKESSDSFENFSNKLKLLCDNMMAMSKKCDEIERENTKVKEISELLMKCNAELESEREEIKSLNIKCITLEAQLDELREKEKTMEAEKEAAVAEAREKLINDRRIELELMRSHFDRSSSDLSLEKIERPKSSAEAVIDLLQHEQLMVEQRAEFEAEKERAINEALERERAIWQTNFSLNSESVIGNISILKDMIEEKERQLDLLREQVKLFGQENFELKTRINVLTNEEGNSWLKEKIEYLTRDKRRLEAELNMVKSKRVEMETSVATAKTTSSSEHVVKPKLITLDSCVKDDLVFVVWNPRHWQYVVVQDSSVLYFLHTDTIAELNFKVPERYGYDNDMPLYFIGRVKEKEYCVARKSENRYHVEKGTKFYRVKLTPGMLRSSRRDDEVPSFSGALGVSVAVAGSGAVAGASARHGSAAAAATVITTATVHATTTAFTTPATMSTSVSVPMTTSPMLTTSTAILTTSTSSTTTSTPPPLPIKTKPYTNQQMQIQNMQQEAVITEQPTAAAAKKMLADLLLEVELQNKVEEVAKMDYDDIHKDEYDDDHDDDDHDDDDHDDDDHNDDDHNDDDHDDDNHDDDDHDDDNHDDDDHDDDDHDGDDHDGDDHDSDDHDSDDHDSDDHDSDDHDSDDHDSDDHDSDGHDDDNNSDDNNEDNHDNEYDDNGEQEKGQKKQNVADITHHTNPFLTASNTTPSTTDAQQQQEQDEQIFSAFPNISLAMQMHFGDECRSLVSPTKPPMPTTAATTTSTNLKPQSLAFPLYSVNTISEDSDEYRSLDARDEIDFLQSEQ